MKTAEPLSAPFSFPQHLPSLFFEPRRYRPHGVGYWSGHIPFACDLVHTLRPQTLVELGTHTGESYFAFCQAVEESGIDCRAFAVDTWRGDQHTGAYSERVFEEVKTYNTRYQQFSSLLRITFDEAAPRFSENSIDLLHIDGAHVYEAVKHDFELWWPKVKAGGVVIMHDSNERGHDFGVWRWLEELRQRFPAEEFLQSHGLGVVIKPPLPSRPNVAAALVQAQSSGLQAIRRYYEMCAAFERERYLQTQRKPGEWDVNAQLFWRGEDEGFSEGRSVRAAEIAGAAGETLLLPIPATPERIAELRIVPSLEPALLTMKEFWIEDSRGTRLYGEHGLSALARWRTQGLQTAAGSQGAIVFDKRGTNALTFPVQRDVAESLRSGGRLYLTLVGMEPFACATDIAASSAPGEPEGEKRSLLRQLLARR